jgi:integrase
MTAGGLSAQSVQAYTTPLKAVFTAAGNNGDVGRHPFVGAKLPPLPSRAVDEMLLPSDQQVQDIAGEFRREWALSVWLMAGLGFRMGEMLGLRVGDFLDDRVGISLATYLSDAVGGAHGSLRHRSGRRPVPDCDRDPGGHLGLLVFLP